MTIDKDLEQNIESTKKKSEMGKINRLNGKKMILTIFIVG